MATAERIRENKKEVEEVTLSLTKTEAEVIYALTQKTLGEGKYGSASDRIFYALDSLGDYYDAPTFNSETGYFKGEEE